MNWDKFSNWLAGFGIGFLTATILWKIIIK